MTARTRRHALALAALAAVSLSACSSDPGTTPDPTEPAPTGAAVECLPVPGDTLVALSDDLQLQNADNIIPAINADAASEALIAALDAVSAELTTEDLVSLNRATDIDRATSSEAAQQWLADTGVTAPQSGSGTVVIGAANFNENITIAEIYAGVLRDAGFDVSVRDIGNRETYLPALLSGEIHVVPEYAATLGEFLNIRANGDGAEAIASGDVDATIAAMTPLAADEGIVLGAPAPGQNQNAFAVTTAFSEQYGVTTLSELAEVCGPVVLGGPPECPERPFCQIGLEETYGVEVAEFRSLDAGGPLTKTALTTGDIAVGLVFSTDGALG